MAEKKFAGAPFGTQTARFDVTGVHPKNKVPGSFTQMPYDKFSMIEMEGYVAVQTQKRQNDNSTVFSRFDRHLKNIRQNLSEAKEQARGTPEVYKYQNKKSTFLQPKEESNYTNKNIRHSSELSSPNSSDSIIKEHYNQEQFSRWTKNQIQKSQRAYLFNAKNSRDSCGSSELRKKKYNRSMSDTEEGPISDSSSEENLNGVNNNNSDSKQILNNLNKSGGHNNQTNDPSQDGSESVKEDMATKESVLQQGKNDKTSISTSMKVQAEEDLSSSVGTSYQTDIQSQTSFQTENQGIRESSKSSKQSTAKKVPTELQTILKSGEEKEIKLKSALSSGSNRSSISVEKKVSFVSETGSRSSLLKGESHGQNTSSKGESRGQNNKIPEINKSVRKEDTDEKINTSLTQEKKEEVKNERWKRIKDAKNKVFCGTCDEFLKRKLGPGTYNTMIGSFSSTAVDLRASGPGWARQLEVERLASLPHLLHKEQWEENRLLKRKLGPGSYEIKDFVQAGDEKPRSDRGICQNLAPRFEKGIQSATPGPGTYGIGGVPQRAIEEKDKTSASTKGMLDAGDRKRMLPSVGSQLGPGTYKHKTCTEEMIKKVTSLRGPYELYSGDRNKPISEGYLAAPKLADLGPGQYEIGSFVDEWKGQHKNMHGKFGKMSQYPDVPTDRIFLFSQAHFPKMKDSPGPGAYSAQELSKPRHLNSPGFLSSAKRDDKISQKFFTRNFNPVGAGRYDIQKFEEAQDINGHSSVFKSKSGKPNLQMSKFLQERIRAKDVSPSEKVFIQPPQRSLTVM